MTAKNKIDENTNLNTWERTSTNKVKPKRNMKAKI